ncbi:nucleotidyltransferase domain protein [Halalkaliarchaeum desulfuricum]|uniref:Nucleotidyltransferase domain protein n=1 Tax=Halalkaliarchaeum desulfuricum TaxID=2055893 RepID=A0A343TH29_9EURY|nr:nucleotidyltransferase domain-containing protein [Halalkaliarchaeum desulfuricum]AUX08401.1 nucleotidyltransferase domain protein [Halalkaliarchaeum desulfuricum]
MPEDGAPTLEGVDVEGIREYLEGWELEFALLFGSRARGDSEASSDIDVALRFPKGTDEGERFRRRNRIDAALQAYADGFVDVSDIDRVPTPIAYRALQDGVVLLGDERTVEAYRKRVEAEYEATAEEREREHREFIDRLASGDV